MNEAMIKVFSDMATYEDYLGRTFPAKAYRSFVETLKGLDFNVTDPEQIKGMPGVGSGILGKVTKFLETSEKNADGVIVKPGTFDRYEEFKASEAAAVMQIAEIKGIGMKTAKKLYSFGITSLDKLKYLTETMQPGEKIYDENGSGDSVTFTNAMKIGLTYEAHTDKNRMTVDVHNGIADPIIATLKTIPGVVEVSPAGSARRFDNSEGYTIGDVDLVVGLSDMAAVGKIQKLMSSVLDEVTVSGDKKISGIKDRRQVDVRMTPIDDYGAMLLYSTGPQSFNIICRKTANKNGWTLNEYGLFDDATKTCIAKDEKEILDKLGIGWIEPKDRKDFKM